jgi:hypothetical protein
MTVRDGVFKRIVIPQGKVSEIGDISYNDSDAVGFEITLTGLPDKTGNSHYDYILDTTV